MSYPCHRPKAPGVDEETAECGWLGCECSTQEAPSVPARVEWWSGGPDQGNVAESSLHVGPVNGGVAIHVPASGAFAEMDVETARGLAALLLSSADEAERGGAP